jgi:hypothetical protein
VQGERLADVPYAGGLVEGPGHHSR